MKVVFYIFFFLTSCLKTFSQEYLPKSEGELVRHKYYTLSYNELHEQANWVHFKLNPILLKGTTPRVDSFIEDSLVSTNSSGLTDYKGSGYDRGHLVPAADMRYSKESMRESFFMSNISPQNPNFNRGIWRKLEQLIREWGRKGEIFITTGGVLNNEILGSIGYNKVSIPSKFYKIVYSVDKNTMIGFLIPNKKTDGKLENYVVSVDSIELITDIDFYKELPNDLEKMLESKIDIHQWGLDNSKNYKTSIKSKQ